MASELSALTLDQYRPPILWIDCGRHAEVGAIFGGAVKALSG